MGFTKEQTQAIENDGANILVSAAAGSGKTTVLVARIINKIIMKKIDIDKLLIVTFTNAAASEMKERLLKALYDEIDKNPNDVHLQKQVNLINQAHISTISSFCLDVIRNNFFEIGMSANFRVGDPAEIEILKQEAIEEVFENNYELQNEDFLDLLNKYTIYKDDEPLKNIILKLFDFTSSIPYPHKWINQAVEDYNVEVEDFAQTKWGKIIIDRAKQLIDDSIISLERAKKMLYGNSNLMKPYELINEDINDLKSIDFSTWDKAFLGINSKVFNPWSAKRKLEQDEIELKEKAKGIRDEVKKVFEKQIKKSLFIYNSNESISDIKKMYFTLKKIERLLLEFEEGFSSKKKERNVVDFSDIEHTALNLLIDKQGKKTEIAKQNDFNEILIDEYQDSNLIQESILSAISSGNNLFMVGDVKQSIYRFRQARPDLFIEKYEKYDLIKNDNEIKDDTKIQLYKNFRSREEVLNFSNVIFQNIMSKQLGEIEYNEDEYLNYVEKEEKAKIDCKSEMYIIETKESDEKDEEREEEIGVVDNATLEARLACKKIKELHNEGIDYKDIAILLRSPGTVGAVYEKELLEAGIPVFSDATSEYLESIEIDTIISLLKIIDNPLQDIPLVSVLRSPIGGFNDNELIEIRLNKKEGNYYNALVETSNDNNELGNKVKDFLNKIDEFRMLQNEIPLDELIWKIYSETGYYHFVRLMPNGKLRQANLRKLFEKAKEYEKISFKGLFNFIGFIEKVASKSSSNLIAAKIIGEKDDVVRIMSIHKSKGLEFPVVILCGVEKRFNEQDMKTKIIYDQDIGIGINYIDDGIEYPTLTKDAINIKAKKELVSEEMRILYVALTRAKDKLIIIGADQNVQKKLNEKESEVEKYHGKGSINKLNNNLVEKYNRFIDWIELVYKTDKKLNLNLEIIPKSEIKYEEKIENENRDEIDRKIDRIKFEEIDKLLKWNYNYSILVEAPSKTSVTALKNCKIKIKNDEIFMLDDRVTEKEIIPLNLDFNEQDKNLTPAEKGTLIHLVLQKLENEDVNSTIDNLKVNKEEKDFLKNNQKIIEEYIKTPLFKDLKNAIETHKETPFYINIKYKNTGESVLVQGVIDLYYINQNNELILVDYKTDQGVNEEILKQRYINQLEIYKVALKRALKRDVKKCCIYSTFLNKLIKI
ncbi:MAG: helicase-exonuclease AddAB subunit AddA [Clostridia bacterium]|nr:helicase-exonuclease AddAB subunit AddA [Clostridia bacterium]